MKLIRSGLLVSLAALAFVTACASKASSTATPLPTAKPFPSYVFQEPTTLPQFANIAATEAKNAAQSATVAPPLVERGKGRWDALACGTCHGDKGEGTPKGSALAGTKLNETDFLTFLRTGGTVGSSHLYAQNKLSESGAHNLYLYVLSLAPAK